MARENALSIYLDNDTKDQLAEIYGEVIELVQTKAISEQIKNKNYSGEPQSGSVVINRFANAQVDDYGTARAAAKGKKIKNTGKVTINVDTDKEIIEELSNKDMKLYGVVELAKRRKKDHAKKLEAYLDTQFFARAVLEGTELTNITDPQITNVIDALVDSIQTTQNDWVDGVDKDQIVLIVRPSIFKKLRNHISKENGNYYYDDSILLYETHRVSVDAMCMIVGAVAQLVTADQYDLQQIPLSNDFALPLFFSKGTKAVMPDLIKYITTITATDTVDVNVTNTAVGVNVANTSLDVNVTNDPLVVQEQTASSGTGGEGGAGGEGGTT